MVNSLEWPLSQHESKFIQIEMLRKSSNESKFVEQYDLTDVKGLHGEIYPVGFSDENIDMRFTDIT